MKIDPTVTPVAIPSTDQKIPQPQLPAPSSGKDPVAPHSAEPAGDKVSISIQIAKKNLDTLQQFGQLGDFLNTLATNLRRTKEGLNASSETVDKMKAPLEAILKNFPPFTIDSQDRMKLLMSYNGLQKEMKSLMVPPPPPPVYEKVQHLWEGLFSGKDGTIPAIELPLDAPDSHVKLAAGQLESVSSQIGIIGEELSKSITAM